MLISLFKKKQNVDQLFLVTFYCRRRCPREGPSTSTL